MEGWIGQPTCRCPYPECDGGYLDKRQIIAMTEYHEMTPGYTKEIHSGVRCPRWNIHEGGVSNSQHPPGKATDFKVLGMAIDQAIRVAEQVEFWNNGGIGAYIRSDGRWFIHCDCRGHMARWFHLDGKKQSWRQLKESGLFVLS